MADDVILALFRTCAERGWGAELRMWLGRYEDDDDGQGDPVVDPDRPSFAGIVTAAMVPHGTGMVPTGPTPAGLDADLIEIGIGRADDPASALRLAIARAEELLPKYAAGDYEAPEEPVNARLSPMSDDDATKWNMGFGGN